VCVCVDILHIGDNDDDDDNNILVITIMQGIYNCIPETNQVSRVCSVAAALYL
jgi:hypothetical protein